MATKRQRARKALRRLFHNRPDRGTGLGEIPLPVHPENLTVANRDVTPVTENVPLSSGMQVFSSPPVSSTIETDSKECWEAAKRRRQSKDKTRALYVKKMAEKGHSESAALAALGD